MILPYSVVCWFGLSLALILYETSVWTFFHSIYFVFFQFADEYTMKSSTNVLGLFRLFSFLSISNQLGIAQLNLPIFDYIYQRTNNFNESIRDTNLFFKEYDFIVIGSGSGGAVVTNRLTEIDGFTVLLLEAGGEENFVSDVPLTPSATQLTSKSPNLPSRNQSGKTMQCKLDRYLMLLLPIIIIMIYWYR